MLAGEQREIADGWMDAYRKYLGPLPEDLATYQLLTKASVTDARDNPPCGAPEPAKHPLIAPTQSMRSSAMKMITAVFLAGPIIASTPSFASECGMQIQAIERRMHSTGAAEVTGQPASPASKSQASNSQGKAPAPVNPSQKPSAEKMKSAQALIEQAKVQDRDGDKDRCERTMMNAQQTIGAMP